MSSSLLFSFFLITVSLLLNFKPAVAYNYFPARIPNGQNVPNPCQPQNNWPGVGHQAAGGAGPRNPFGLDFADAGYTWDINLCQKDSDQDGVTNGQELGDPKCVWRVGDEPENTTGITHPGICEPINSTDCIELQPWLICPPTFSCPDFALPTTQNISLRFEPQKIPTEDTTYICQGFKLPDDQDYHIIGDIPIINNSQILHHMLLYGCGIELSDAELTTPFACTMGVAGCDSLIGAWAVGDYGQCHAKEFGFPMGGQSGFKYAVLQLHWNNAGLLPDLVDSSGMTIYYTNQTRPNAGKMVLIGQLELHLPPRQDRVAAYGSCTSPCTALLPSPVNIAVAVLHMHMLGRSGDVALVRKNGTRIILVNETSYSYNSPKFYYFDQHIPFQAGDEIQVNCVYRTTNKDVSTEWGEGTNEEMCYTFLTIYPSVPNFDSCSEWRDVPVCSLDWYMSYPNCNVTHFQDLNSQALLVCDNGKSCTEECKPLCEEMRQTSCLDGSSGDFIKDYWPKPKPALGDLYKLAETCGKTGGGSSRVGRNHLAELVAFGVILIGRLFEIEY